MHHSFACLNRTRRRSRCLGTKPYASFRCMSVHGKVDCALASCVRSVSRKSEKSKLRRVVPPLWILMSLPCAFKR